ncbi:unnamed protein product [Rotaria socialis]|uniref:PPPDE domain-containing protein n=1 Tax=Rotaria socialis TaxID=392032 RepID=A0A817RIZ6_9BILA|nr:unnamed protein product [Rotaria socialis]CAF3356211.1 unnamed protein product [Rotaria socialis]CAF3391399.1 unnamed protein product [Rotaria socialis]CAF4230686.1 unnamed protein product [Rotaria socialis]CAF4330868.1 unnamed protein product [Rotaria socialis]
MNSANYVNNNKTAQQTNAAINKTISSPSSLHQGTNIAAVYLNLYDLGGCINACVHSVGLSYYHCALQAHSAEYGYMGHPFKFTGLYKTSKHDSRFHVYRLRDSIEIGWTWFSEKEIDQIVHVLKPVYLGLDYHTVNKNSIHFAKYLLEQLANDSQLKHIEPIKIINFPSYINRSRRLTDTLKFLKIFDRESDIAEINILYFLYMNYEGNMKQICHILQCDTIDKLKRYVELIEQGIQLKKLPIFSALTKLNLKTTQDYLNTIDQRNYDVATSTNEQVTLTDIFHQFDSITLRGRTSIDRYLNIQRTKEFTQQFQNENVLIDRRSIPFNHQQELDSSHSVEIPQLTNRNGLEIFSKGTDSIKQNQPIQKSYTIFPPIHRTSLSHSKSQNQVRTPSTSPSGSHISETIMKSNENASSLSTHVTNIIPTSPVLFDPVFRLENLLKRSVVPIETIRCLQEKSSRDFPLNELYLTTNDDHNMFSLITRRQRKNSYSLHKRKLPRDLELNKNLYIITNQNSLFHNYTNNSKSTISSFSQC